MLHDIGVQMATVADLFVHRLKQAGVRMLFGVPGGGGNLDVIEAARQIDLPFVLTATETAGAIAAIAQSEITGAPGVCLGTLGPGAASLANGVACAFLDRASLLVLTDEGPEPYEHQRFDQAALFRSITRWSGRIDPLDPRKSIDDIVWRLQREPRGPIHVDCPIGSWSHQIGFGPPGIDVRVDESSDEPLALELASRARKPLVVVGLGAR